MHTALSNIPIRILHISLINLAQARGLEGIKGKTLVALKWARFGFNMSL